ncbi:hypothetical protein NITUZ_30305 [Candidatus Nitrosotenuis uzonensis]|uniref:Uncharacterized protein n=1 Tax=Candidatus Nitrosotenuis uzonensis TaxID=1407055 RepID=V6AT30_9ARCH|nr:hypothetical protein NITUZ_30305 [Candidatus Nitrosotenuis uzonensis]
MIIPTNGFFGTIDFKNKMLLLTISRESLQEVKMYGYAWKINYL